MIRSLLILCVCVSSFAQGLIVNPFRFGSAPPAPTYIYEQNFDGAGAPSGWNTASGTPDYDYVTAPAPLEGTQSYRLLDSEGSFTDNIFDLSNVWIYFQWHPVNHFDQQPIMYILDSGLNPLLTIRVNAPSGGNSTISVVVTGGAGTQTTAATFAEGTTLHIWAHYDATGVGAGDTIGEIWFSTTTTKPADLSANHAKVSNGTATVNARRLQTNGSFATTDYIFDKIRVDDVAIGSGPP